MRSGGGALSKRGWLDLTSANCTLPLAGRFGKEIGLEEPRRWHMRRGIVMRMRRKKKSSVTRCKTGGILQHLLKEREQEKA
jgi:hypothetical protein